MKIRQGFVSNSSSSSFIVNTHNLTHKQRDFVVALEKKSDKTGWHIIHNFPVIFGYTDMDNYDMKSFLEKKGLPTSKFKFYHSNNEFRKSILDKSFKTCSCRNCRIYRKLCGW